MAAEQTITLPPLPFTGGCQCGRVRYRLTAPPLTFYACHCTECQHQSSSAFGLSMRVPADALTIRGTTATTGRADPASPKVEGVFCPSCGSRIIHRRPGASRPRVGETVTIKAGTLDDTTWLVPVGHLWVRSAMQGFRPAPGPLIYDGQPDSFDDLIAAWAAATGGNT